MKEQLLIGRCRAEPAPALKSEAEALGGAQRERHDEERPRERDPARETTREV